MKRLSRVTRLSESIILIVLLVASLLPLLSLTQAGLPVTHDGQDHVARVANFYQSLAEGNIVPRWAANLNWGYGHPILMFLYPLPSYFASVFHAIGFSLVDSTKLVFAAAYIASVFTMYSWLRAQWGVLAGFVGAILYGFAPYRFVDLYVRGAIGEHVAFIFSPLILLGLWRLAHGRGVRYSGALTALAVAGLVLSHNAVSLMVLPIVALYALYLFFFEAKHRQLFLVHSSWFIVLGFFLSAFFWMPAFFEGKYTLRDIVTKGEFGDRFVPWSWFFYSPWNYGGGTQFAKQLGIAHWMGVVAIVWLLCKKRSARFFGGSLIILLVLSLFLITKESKFIWSNINLLQKFQFPWRLLTLTTFISAIIGAFVVTHVQKRYIWTVAIGLSLFAIVTTTVMWRAKDYQVKPESFYTEIYEGTTDTGESSPIWSVRFMEKRPSAPIEVIEGEATIETGLRTTTTRKYFVNAKVQTRLVENTLYFPGWNILVDGEPTTIEFQDPTWRGLMTFWVNPGDHSVNVIFGETKLRRFANIISVSAIVLLILSLYGKGIVR